MQSCSEHVGGIVTEIHIEQLNHVSNHQLRIGQEHESQRDFSDNESGDKAAAANPAGGAASSLLEHFAQFGACPLREGMIPKNRIFERNVVSIDGSRLVLGEEHGSNVPIWRKSGDTTVL